MSPTKSWGGCPRTTRLLWIKVSNRFSSLSVEQPVDVLIFRVMTGAAVVMNDVKRHGKNVF